MSAIIPASVRRGAALLDTRLPGWWEVLDEDTLDLGNQCNCILGEIFGDYDKGQQILGLSDTEAKHYGFFTRGTQLWDTLTDGWRVIITQRRRSTS